MSDRSTTAARIRIRRAEVADSGPVARLIEPAFVRFIAPALSTVGRVAFRLYVTDKALRARLAAGAVAWCAVADEAAIVGYAELRGSDGTPGGLEHLSLLFTAPTHHRQGIARELLATLQAHLRADAPELRRLTVNASAYALPIYERLGFVRAAAAFEEGGIVATPMVLGLDGPPADTSERSD